MELNISRAAELESDDVADVGMEAAHQIEIERTGYHSRGAWYRVAYNGAVLIERCRDPEFDACRKLKAMGVTGTLRTRHKGSSIDSVVLNIAKGSGSRTQETETVGPRIVKWKPFYLSGATDDETEDSDLPRTRAGHHRG